MKNRDWQVDFCAWLIVSCVAFVILMMCFGCRSRKETLREVTSTQLQVTSDESRKSNTTANFDWSKTDQSTFDFQKEFGSNFNFSMKIYDTGKPVDTITGKPPISSEITGTFTKSAGETGIVKNDIVHSGTANIEREEQSNEETDYTSDVNSDGRADFKSDTRPVQGFEWITIIVGCIIGLILIVSAIVWWVKRK